MKSEKKEPKFETLSICTTYLYLVIKLGRYIGQTCLYIPGKLGQHNTPIFVLYPT